MVPGLLAAQLTATFAARSFSRPHLFSFRQTPLSWCSLPSRPPEERLLTEKLPLQTVRFLFQLVQPKRLVVTDDKVAAFNSSPPKRSAACEAVPGKFPPLSLAACPKAGCLSSKFISPLTVARSQACPRAELGFCLCFFRKDVCCFLLIPQGGASKWPLSERTRLLRLS